MPIGKLETEMSDYTADGVFFSDPIAHVPNATLYESKAAPYQWNVNSVAIDHACTRITGWALPWFGTLNNTQLVVNGHHYIPNFMGPFSQFADLYPWCPHAEMAPFSLEIPHSRQDLRNVGEIDMKCTPVLGGPVDRSYTLHLVVSDLNFQIPNPEIAARIGVSDAMHYVMFGRSIFRSLEKALDKNFGTQFSDYPLIVDWGCGSGRVARHTLGALGGKAKLMGIDIDEVAVGWANENLGNHFSVGDLQPPLKLADGSVDLLYAYSVFTHLADNNFRTWVNELARVIKPGGVALFTVLSENSMICLLSGIGHQVLSEWQKDLIYDSAHNAQLESMGVSGDYYRNVWVKKAYLDSCIEGKFEVVDYVDCFHFYQDLVVLRRL
jgi:SAM-dependent methyltransferase